MVIATVNSNSNSIISNVCNSIENNVYVRFWCV